MTFWRRSSSATRARYPCPGVTLIQIFLADVEEREAIVLPFPKVKPCTKLFYRCIQHFICAFFLIGFLADVVDVAAGGDYRETEFGKVNPLISLISFCASQIGFFMAVSAAFFLVSRFSEILQCAEVLNKLVHTFKLDVRSSSRRVPFAQLFRIKVYFYLVLLMGLLRFSMAMWATDLSSESFKETAKYALVEVPAAAVPLYAHGTMLLSILFYYPVNTLFTYLSSILMECLRSFHQENKLVLYSLSNPRTANEVPFIIQLRAIRSRNELINSAFDQLQRTFGLKLLLDIAGNVSVVMSAIAWFTIFGADPPKQNMISVLRHLLAAFIYLLTVWVVGNQPLALVAQHKKAMELMEKIIHKRQITSQTKPTREELGLTIAVLERFKSKDLTFSAGGVIDVSPIAISTLFALISGFTCFAIDRAENYRSALEETKAVAANMTGNITCGF